MAPAAVDVALPTDRVGAAGGDHSRARGPDGRRESDVGRAADSRGIGQAGSHGIGANRVAAAAATASALISDVADLSHNHVASLVSMDFFTVPTLTGRVLFVLVLLAHQRRRIVHINITEHPTAAWTAQQLIEAFPDDTAPRWLLRDRDANYGDAFRRRVAGMGIGEVLASRSSPWQNPYAERVIGSIRRECLDHVIVLGDWHLRRLLTSYLTYYHGARTHLALAKDALTPRRVQLPTEGCVVAFPEVGGLHHLWFANIPIAVRITSQTRRRPDELSAFRRR